MKVDKTGSYPFVVEPFQEDVTGHLSTAVLGNLLLRCANLQAGSMGYGYRDMIKHKAVWVLARLQVEMETMPTTHQPYSINTWFSGSYRQFSDRHYRLLDEDGAEIGRAITTWSLIDTETRQAIELSTFDNGSLNRCATEDKVVLSKSERVRLKMIIPERSVVARFSDLDINGHVNSIRYISHALDLFDKSFHDSHHLLRYDVAYSAESYCGDTLHLYHEAIDTLTHHIEVRVVRDETAQEEVACRIRFVFTPRQLA